jgi:hypothetical protein
MAEHRDQDQASSNHSWSIFLEIDTEEEQGLIHVPTIIKRLSGATVTLEVANPWHLAGVSNMLQKKVRLFLAPPAGGQPVFIEAGVRWANWLGDKKREMLLGVELTNPRLETYRLLESHLAYSPKDLKRLWERYDQARQEPQDSLVDRRLYLAGLVLLLGGLVLQIPEPRSLKLLGWLLWLFSSLGLAGACLWSLWQKRASH